jgi:hypothetical protein
MEHPAYRDWLSSLLHDRGAQAGTVHLLRDGELVLVAAINIPPPVVDKVSRVPPGKGMAGLALSRGVPVQTCNLQTDATGDVRPGARAVDAQAAVALPVRGPAGAIRAVVGVAFAEERALPADELAALQRAAATLP